MTQTDHYKLNIVEGTDLVNPLTQLNPNFETLDSSLYTTNLNTISTANELKTLTTHAITRADPNTTMFRFTATSDFAVGDTFTVDGVQAVAYLPNGEPLPAGAFRIGTSVLCAQISNVLTIYTAAGLPAEINRTTLNGKQEGELSVLNSEQLGGVDAAGYKRIEPMIINNNHPDTVPNGDTVRIASLTLEPGSYLINGGIRWNQATANTAFEIAFAVNSNEINYNDPTSHIGFRYHTSSNGPSGTLVQLVELSATSNVNLLFTPYGIDARIYNSSFRAIKI